MYTYVLESDFSYDFLRWIRKCEEKNIPYNFYKKKKLKYSQQQIEEFQNEIIKDKDSAFAYFFTMEFPYKIYLMQQLILDNKDFKYAFLFAQNVPGCNIKKIQKLIIDSKKIKYICKLACFVKGVDLKKIEPLILKSKKAQYAHMWMKYIKNYNMNKFKKIILDSKKPRYLFALAKQTSDPKEIYLIEDLIIKCKSCFYIRLFAEKIKLANIDKLEQAILATNDFSEIKKFAQYVKKSRLHNCLYLI